MISSIDPATRMSIESIPFSSRDDTYYLDRRYHIERAYHERDISQICTDISEYDEVSDSFLPLEILSICPDESERVPLLIRSTFSYRVYSRYTVGEESLSFLKFSIERSEIGDDRHPCFFYTVEFSEFPPDIDMCDDDVTSTLEKFFVGIFFIFFFEDIARGISVEMRSEVMYVEYSGDTQVDRRESRKRDDPIRTMLM